MKKKSVIFIGCLLLVGVSAALAFQLLQPPKPPGIPTTPVTREDIEETVLATGTLSPFKTVEVGAQVSGQLKRLHVELGDEVKKGQLLAEIDPVLAENSLKEAAAEQENLRAQVEAKQVLLKQYRLAFKRQQQMSVQDATSRADLEHAEAQFMSSQAELRALQSQFKKAAITVDTAKANLGYTRISAPMDGVVISIAAEEGQTLVSAQSVSTILTIGNLDRMTVKPEISEADVVRVAAGQTVYFTILGEPDVRIYGTLRAIEPGPTEDSSSSSSSNAVYYNGLFEVDNLDRKLRVGMTAEVTIVRAAVKQALVAPVAVLRTTTSDGAVVEVLENGRPVLRKVQLGLNDKVKVQLLDGVSEGEPLVVQQLQVKTSADSSNRRPGPPPGGS